MSHNSSKKLLKVGRFQIPCRIYESSGPQIICLNGVQQSMAMWQSVVSRFSGRCRIILFDFPNQGKAKIISGPQNASLDEQVEILAAVIKATGNGKKLVISSASWSGVVALLFALKYNQKKIERLILGSLGARPNQKMVETIRKGAQMDPDNRREMADTLIKSFGQQLPEAIQQKIVAQFHRMTREALAAFCEHGLFVLSGKQIGDVVDLKKIKVKTVLINGENDTILDLKDVKFLASQIPDCELRIIKNTGHFLHLENEKILDIYEEIISGIK